MYCIQEAVHFLNRIGYQYCLEVIAVFQSAADAGGNGVYIFKHRTVFDAGYVVADGSLDEAASQTAGEDARFVLVRAGDGQIREAFQRYFFCVAGPASTAMFSGGTPYSFVKYSDTITLSSGTIPLIAVIINLSLIFVFSFFR